MTWASVSTLEIEMGRQRLSGRAVEPEVAARAIVFALHEGSYSSCYYDLRSGPRASAMQNYANLGYRVIALDRLGLTAPRWRQRAAGHCLDVHRAGYAHHLATASLFETRLAALG